MNFKSAMCKVYAFILLFAVFVVAESHGYKGKRKGGKGGKGSHHYFNVSENALFTWEQAEGYLECEEFLDVPDFDQATKEKLADNFDERGYFRKQPKPRPLEKCCSDWECAPSLNSTSPGCGFQTRTLYRGNWVTTHLDLTGKDAFSQAIRRLHKYRRGEANSLKEYLGKARPVMRKWYLNANYNITSATMSFYIPSPYQQDPPASLDKDVKVEQWDEVDTYIRAWGGSRDDAGYWPQSGQEFDYLGTALSKVDIKWYPYIRMTGSYVGRKELLLVSKDITVTPITGKNPDHKFENE